MLIATITFLILLFSGSAGLLDTLQSSVHDHVDDEVRVERADALIASMQAVVDAYEADIRATRQQVLVLDDDHGATVADFQAMFGALDATWIMTETELIDLRFELRDTLTREEWAAVFDDLEAAQMAEQDAED